MQSKGSSFLLSVCWRDPLARQADQDRFFVIEAAPGVLLGITFAPWRSDNSISVSRGLLSLAPRQNRTPPIHKWLWPSPLLDLSCRPGKPQPVMIGRPIPGLKEDLGM